MGKEKLLRPNSAQVKAMMEVTSRIDAKLREICDAEEAQRLAAQEAAEKLLEDRIGKELEKNRKFLASLEGKLSNEGFISRAPEAVVNAEKEKAVKTRDLIAQLQQSLEAMQKL